MSWLTGGTPMMISLRRLLEWPASGRGLRPARASSHWRGILDDRILRRQVLTILHDVAVFDVCVWLLTDPVTVIGATPLADIPLHGGVPGAHQGEVRHVSQSLDRPASSGNPGSRTGTGHPAGRKHHSCVGPDGDLMVYEVWESQQALDDYSKVLMPILEKIGIDPGTLDVMPVHNLAV